MINPFKDVNWHPDRTGLKSFGRSLVIGFPIVAMLFFVIGRLTTGTWSPAILLQVGGIGAALGALFILAPSIARPFYVVWYGVACSIGLVVSNVLLTGVFYGVFAPIGLAMRLAGRNPLSLKLDRSLQTYWLTVIPSRDRARYFRQF
jgi:Saxitoxin biosynthesis operon protein SxtJ